MTKEIVKTTCPRDCYDACGIVAVKRDGVLRKVLGDPDHPVSRGALCGKCALAYNGAWRDPAARLSQPLLRDGPKGSGRFREIDWETALDRIAAALRQEAAAGRPERVLHTHYTGTCSALAGNFPMRFFNRLGATEVDPDSICNKAGHVALSLLYGSSLTGFDPRSLDDSRCILVWGANPSASAPHAHKHWLGECDATVIVVDPIRHATAAQATLHLQPFPGSDAALAFALLHVLQREGLTDDAFLADHCEGWAEVLPLLAPCTPAWGEEQTGVPAAQIEQAARLYGAGPSMLWLGQGLQRQATGGNIMRAAGLLPAASGNIGKPGTGIYYLNGGWAQGLKDVDLSGESLCRTSTPRLSHMDLAATLADPERARVLMSWNMNVAASGPRQKALKAALAREDLFTVVIDLFQTDTADYADIVLPAASFLEFDDLVVPYFHLALSAQAKVTDPPGSALPNQEIFRRLAAAMGYDEAALFEDDRSIIDRLLADNSLGVDFAELKTKGTVFPKSDPLIPFSDLAFPTPSGKIEIASSRAEAKGLPRVPQPWADARPAAGRLRLLSPSDVWLMNNSYGNDPAVRARLGAAAVSLHPEDADARGLTEGASVELANETGCLTLTLQVSDAVPRGVALSPKGRWARFEEAGANVNLLNPGAKSDMGESSAVHGIEVTLRAL